MPPLPYEVSPAEAQQKLAAGEACLIDVREEIEFLTARIDGAELIPMDAIPGQLQHLDRLAGGQLLVLYCHHGVRSLNAVGWLRQQGVANCVSMAGGIDRWSLLIDPSVPRY